MSKKTTYLLGILFTIIIGSILYWLSNCIRCENTTLNANTNIPIDATTVSEYLNPFSISGADFDIGTSENFKFNTSGHTILAPIPEGLDTPIEKLKNYLSQNPSKVLKVMGYFKGDESNTSSFGDLGMARAEAIKKQLSARGISVDKILTSGVMNEGLRPDASGVLHGPYALLLDDDLSKRDAAFKNALLASPTLLNFELGKYTTSNRDLKKSALGDLADYLNAYENRSCTIVGHCDSDGSAKFNMGLGQRRADFTKSQLLKLNVDPHKVKTESKGESAPIATNNTLAGKAKNRRTDVIIN